MLQNVSLARFLRRQRDRLFGLNNDPIKPKKGPEVFTGRYASWADAMAECTGYDASEIFQRTKDAALAVRHGFAIYERDSVLFHEPSLNWPLVAALLRQAALDSGRLSVLDFGGSLGSHFFQSRHFIAGLSELRWCVVEQAHYVYFGQKELTTDVLRFYPTIEECVQQQNPNVLLLSSVLQYLPDPYALLDLALATGIPALLLDRTPLIAGADRLTIQKVTPDIYDASYPAWFLSGEKVRQRIEASGYRLLSEWNADRLPLDGQDVIFRGCLYVKT